MVGPALPSSAAGSSILNLVHPTNASPVMKRVQIESTATLTKITTIPRKGASASSSTPRKRSKKPKLPLDPLDPLAAPPHDDSEDELSPPPEVFTTDSEDEKDLIVSAVTRIERRMDQSDDDYNPTSRSRRPSTAGSGKLTRATRTATRSRENSFAFSIFSPKAPRSLDKRPEAVILTPDVPKRKRGRPRKIVLDSPVEVDADTEEGHIPSRRRKILPLTPPSDTAFSPLQPSSAPSSIAKRPSIVDPDLANALEELTAARREIEMLKIKLVSMAAGPGDAALTSAKEQIAALREDVSSLERSRTIDREGWELERGRLLRRIKTLEGT